MQITEVKVVPVNEGALRAFVDITFDKCFAIKELRIVQGPDGLCRDAEQKTEGWYLVGHRLPYQCRNAKDDRR